MAAAMFKELWVRRHDNNAAAMKSLKDELVRIDRSIEGTVERLVETSIPAVQRALEKKVESLEAEKLLAEEKFAGSGRIEGTYDTRLRTALGFLANPYSVWKKGEIDERRAVLKLTFADRLHYKRGEGFRTANLTLPFKVLADFATGDMGMAHPTQFERLTFAFGGQCFRRLSQRLIDWSSLSKTHFWAFLIKRCWRSADCTRLARRTERVCARSNCRGTAMSEVGLCIDACLKEISIRLNDAAAVAKASVACAEAGSEREALRIALDLDEPINEARTLHGAVCLIGRMSRPDDSRRM